MTFDYQSLAARAAGLIGRFGAPGTLTQFGEPVYDEGEVTATEVEHPCVAVVFPYGDKYIDGVTVQAGDEQAFLSVVDLVAPTVADTLTLNAVKYQVKGVKIIAPAGVSVLYELHLRR